MKIGFIGLGIMGKPMSKNLVKAGYELVVNDFNQSSIDELVALGAKAAASASEVAKECDVIITMLPNSPHVRVVALGEKGIHETAKPGSIIIDMSSIDPTESKAIGLKLLEKGIRMLDAPVSGGEPKAVDGTLSVMVGGNIAKLANQIVVALNISAVAEALTFAQKAGANPELVYQAIRGGLAGSTVMDAKAPLMLARKFDPGFRIELHIKDLNNALNAGHSSQAALPLTAQAMEILQVLKGDGYAKEDHGAIVKYYEKLSNITLTK